MTTLIPLNISARCELIAEVGSVHDGSFGNALALISAAADCGADAVKFQTHIASAETLPSAPMPTYFQAEPRFDYFQRTAFNVDQWRALKAACDAKSVQFISSPFSIEAVHLLESVGADRYKVGSGEVTNTPMLSVIAETKKPVILSSGMSSWAELDRAVAVFTRVHDRVTLLQCTSEYPCADGDVGLNVMLEMKARYGLPVGLSDHTLELTASIAAAALGASTIERHFAFSRLMYGSDARHSLVPEEMRALARALRAVGAMRAPVDKDAMAGKLQGMKAIFEKSIVSLRPIRAGATLTAADLGAKKPGTGIPAARLTEVIGRRARRDIAADTLLAEEDLDA